MLFIIIIIIISRIGTDSKNQKQARRQPLTAGNTGSVSPLWVPGQLPASPAVDPGNRTLCSVASSTAGRDSVRCPSTFQGRPSWFPPAPGVAGPQCSPPGGPRPGGGCAAARGHPSRPGAVAPAVPRLRSGRGAGAGPAGEVLDAREPMGTLGGAGLAAEAAAGRALSGWRASAGHLRRVLRASRPGAPMEESRAATLPSWAVAAAPPPCYRPRCWISTRTRTTWRCSVR